MKRRLAIQNLITAGAVSLLPDLRTALAQDAKEQPLVRSVVRLVLLDVSVKDRNGSFAAGLTKENFTVLENGVRQPITVFANNDLPVTAGILVDESKSMTPKRTEVLSAAEAFVRESNPQDEIFVLNFSDSVKRGLPEGVLFSNNMNELRSALYRGFPEGRTALYDAIVAGLEQLELGKRERKTLVVISDGGDNASRHKRQQMLDRIERSIVTIYAIGLFTPGEPDGDPAVLRQVAKISGGDAWFPESLAGMASVCRVIATDIRTRYTIGYVPLTFDRARPVRHIQVHVSVPGRSRLIARTRTIYRYDETQE